MIVQKVSKNKKKQEFEDDKSWISKTIRPGSNVFLEGKKKKVKLKEARVVS